MNVSRFGIVAVALLLGTAAVPSAAHAQFGLGKLKKAKEALDKGKELKQAADTVRSAVKSLTGKSTVQVDAGVYNRFAKAAVAEKAGLDAKNSDATALAAAANGFSVEDYAIVKAKIATYVAAKAKKTDLPDGVLSDSEVSYLDGLKLEAIAKALAGTE